jgi:hypothetical protein
MPEDFSKIPAQKTAPDETDEFSEIQTPDYRIGLASDVVEASPAISDTDQSEETHYSYQESGYQTMPIEEKNFRTETSEEGVDNSIFLKEILKEERPLSKHEKELFLNPESLANLSREEYIAVWRQLSPNFVSHITRQGYREPENTHGYHSKGLGEFHNNFVEMLNDGLELKSKFSKNGIEEAVLEHLAHFDPHEYKTLESGEQLEDKNNAWKYVKDKLLTGVNGRHTNAMDESALHLATEQVVESYGAEKNNQIFIIYPSDLIASQFNFTFDGAGRGQSFINNAGAESVNNDLFVWDKEQSTNTKLTLQAGVVFLPKSTLVNKDNGSKYEKYSGADSGQVIKSESSDQAITAMDYWQQYFKDNPEQTPKHVEFYDGDVNQAVHNFLQENKILGNEATASASEVLDFPENCIKDKKEGQKVEQITSDVLARAANALIKYFKEHPELRYEDYIGAEDIEEMQALLVE